MLAVIILRRFDHDANSVRLYRFTDGHGNLFGKPFLDLQTPAVNLDNPRSFNVKEMNGRLDENE